MPKATRLTRLLLLTLLLFSMLAVFASAQEGEEETCSDGTAYSSCSTDLPKYCDASGNLINKCTTCGCPEDKLCNPSTEACSDPPEPKLEFMQGAEDKLLVCYYGYRADQGVYRKVSGYFKISGIDCSCNSGNTCYLTITSGCTDGPRAILADWSHGGSQNQTKYFSLANPFVDDKKIFLTLRDTTSAEPGKIKVKLSNGCSGDDKAELTSFLYKNPETGVWEEQTELEAISSPPYSASVSFAPSTTEESQAGTAYTGNVTLYDYCGNRYGSDNKYSSDYTASIDHAIIYQYNYSEPVGGSYNFFEVVYDDATVLGQDMMGEGYDPTDTDKKYSAIWTFEDGSEKDEDGKQEINLWHFKDAKKEELTVYLINSSGDHVKNLGTYTFNLKERDRYINSITAAALPGGVRTGIFVNEDFSIRVYTLDEFGNHIIPEDLSISFTPPSGSTCGTPSYTSPDMGTTETYYEYTKVQLCDIGTWEIKITATRAGKSVSTTISVNVAGTPDAVQIIDPNGDGFSADDSSYKSSFTGKHSVPFELKARLVDQNGDPFPGYSCSFEWWLETSSASTGSPYTVKFNPSHESGSSKGRCDANPLSADCSMFVNATSSTPRSKGEITIRAKLDQCDDEEGNPVDITEWFSNAVITDGLITIPVNYVFCGIFDIEPPDYPASDLGDVKVTGKENQLLTPASEIAEYNEKTALAGIPLFQIPFSTTKIPLYDGTSSNDYWNNPDVCWDYATKHVRVCVNPDDASEPLIFADDPALFCVKGLTYTPTVDGVISTQLNFNANPNPENLMGQNDGVTDASGNYVLDKKNWFRHPQVLWGWGMKGVQKNDYTTTCVKDSLISYSPASEAYMITAVGEPTISIDSFNISVEMTGNTSMPPYNILDTVKFSEPYNINPHPIKGPTGLLVLDTGSTGSGAQDKPVRFYTSSGSKFIVSTDEGIGKNRNLATISIDRRNRVYVTDKANSRIVVYELSGSGEKDATELVPLAQIPASGQLSFTPHGVAFDSWNRMFVGGYKTGKMVLAVYDEDYSLLTSQELNYVREDPTGVIVAESSYEDSSRYRMDLAVNDEGTRVYVADGADYVDQYVFDGSQFGFGFRRMMWVGCRRLSYGCWDENCKGTSLWPIWDSPQDACTWNTANDDVKVYTSYPDATSNTGANWCGYQLDGGKTDYPKGVFLPEKTPEANPIWCISKHAGKYPSKISPPMRDGPFKYEPFQSGQLGPLHTTQSVFYKNGYVFVIDKLSYVRQEGYNTCTPLVCGGCFGCRTGVNPCAGLAPTKAVDKYDKTCSSPPCQSKVSPACTHHCKKTWDKWYNKWMRKPCHVACVLRMEAYIVCDAAFSEWENHCNHCGMAISVTRTEKWLRVYYENDEKGGALEPIFYGSFEGEMPYKIDIDDVTLFGHDFAEVTDMNGYGVVGDGVWAARDSSYNYYPYFHDGDGSTEQGAPYDEDEVMDWSFTGRTDCTDCAAILNGNGILTKDTNDEVNSANLLLNNLGTYAKDTEEPNGIFVSGEGFDYDVFLAVHGEGGASAAVWQIDLELTPQGGSYKGATKLLPSSGTSVDMPVDVVAFPDVVKQTLSKGIYCKGCTAKGQLEPGMCSMSLDSREAGFGVARPMIDVEPRPPLYRRLWINSTIQGTVEVEQEFKITYGSCNTNGFVSGSASGYPVTQTATTKFSVNSTPLFSYVEGGLFGVAFNNPYKKTLSTESIKGLPYLDYIGYSSRTLAKHFVIANYMGSSGTLGDERLLNSSYRLRFTTWANKPYGYLYATSGVDRFDNIMTNDFGDLTDPDALNAGLQPYYMENLSLAMEFEPVYVYEPTVLVDNPFPIAIDSKPLVLSCTPYGTESYCEVMALVKGRKGDGSDYSNLMVIDNIRGPLHASNDCKFVDSILVYAPQYEMEVTLKVDSRFLLELNQEPGAPIGIKEKRGSGGGTTPPLYNYYISGARMQPNIAFTTPPVSEQYVQARADDWPELTDSPNKVALRVDPVQLQGPLALTIVGYQGENIYDRMVSGLADITGENIGYVAKTDDYWEDLFFGCKYDAASGSPSSIDLKLYLECEDDNGKIFNSFVTCEKDSGEKFTYQDLYPANSFGGAACSKIRSISVVNPADEKPEEVYDNTYFFLLRGHYDPIEDDDIREMICVNSPHQVQTSAGTWGQQCGYKASPLMVLENVGEGAFTPDSDYYPIVPTDPEDRFYRGISYITGEGATFEDLVYVRQDPEIVYQVGVPLRAGAATVQETNPNLGDLNLTAQTVMPAQKEPVSITLEVTRIDCCNPEQGPFFEDAPSRCTYCPDAYDVATREEFLLTPGDPCDSTHVPAACKWAVPEWKSTPTPGVTPAETPTSSDLPTQTYYEDTDLTDHVEIVQVDPGGGSTEYVNEIQKVTKAPEVIIVGKQNPGDSSLKRASLKLPSQVDAGEFSLVYRVQVIDCPGCTVKFLDSSDNSLLARFDVVGDNYTYDQPLATLYPEDRSLKATSTSSSSQATVKVIGSTSAGQNKVSTLSFGGSGTASDSVALTSIYEIVATGLNKQQDENITVITSTYAPSITDPPTYGSIYSRVPVFEPYTWRNASGTFLFAARDPALFSVNNEEFLGYHDMRFVFYDRFNNTFNIEQPFLFRLPTRLIMSIYPMRDDNDAYLTHVEVSARLLYQPIDDPIGPPNQPLNGGVVYFYDNYASSSPGKNDAKYNYDYTEYTKSLKYSPGYKDGADPLYRCTCPEDPSTGLPAKDCPLDLPTGPYDTKGFVMYGITNSTGYTDTYYDWSGSKRNKRFPPDGKVYSANSYEVCGWGKRAVIAIFEPHFDEHEYLCTGCQSVQPEGKEFYRKFAPAIGIEAYYSGGFPVSLGELSVLVPVLLVLALITAKLASTNKRVQKTLAKIKRSLTG